MRSTAAPPNDQAPNKAAVRRNLAEQVYAQLKAEMNDFSLVPGDRFSEAELGQRLGVSRTPVREALFRLRRRLPGGRAKSGWSVRPIDFNLLEQLYDLRVILELAAVANSAPTPARSRQS